MCGYEDNLAAGRGRDRYGDGAGAAQPAHHAARPHRAPVRAAGGTPVNGDCDLWPPAALDTEAPAMFAESFFHSETMRDWRVMGGFAAFPAALLTEMYGFVPTVYLLASPPAPTSRCRPPTVARAPAQRPDRLEGRGAPSAFHPAPYMMLGAGL
jgi:hypothetical protein